MRILNFLNADRLRAPFLYFVCVLCLIYVPIPAHAATPPDAPAVTVIRNATILTVSHGTIEHGSILIKDGKIAEVGQSINAPKDAQVITPQGNSSSPALSTATLISQRKASMRAAFPSPRW